jgi:hypothetical protein
MMKNLTHLGTNEGIEEMIRIDTGEVVSTRVLGPSEKQSELAFARQAIEAA